MSRKSLTVVSSETEALSDSCRFVTAAVGVAVTDHSRGRAGTERQTTAAALGVRRETTALWRRRAHEQGIGCV